MKFEHQGLNDSSVGGGGLSVDVSVVIPCLNESKVLPYCMGLANGFKSQLREELGLSCEIVVSDNGSSDGSGDIAASLGARVVFCQERGYGNALRFGIENALGKYIVMGDADGSYDFKQALPMIKKLQEGSDICMGSRFKGGIEKGAMPWKNRYIGNPVLTGILNLFFKSGISDAHCGLRAFTKETYNRISPSSTGMEFASELVIKASLLRLKMTEVPINLFVDKRESAPHLRPWRDGWRHLRYLLLLSPLWLYFLPSLAFMLVGSALMGALLTAGSGEMVPFGGFSIGDHWAIVAGGFLTVGHLTLLLGLAVNLVGIKEGFRVPGKLIKHVVRFSRLEYMLIFAACLIGAAIVVFVGVMHEWSDNEYRELMMLREVVLANTLFIVGFQNAWGGFLLSSVVGNESPRKHLDKIS